MYTNPQNSDQAKRLRKALETLGIRVSHAQALEASARMEGARTLHVAQAKNNAGVRIADVAKAQAAEVMFESLGRFEGKLDALLEEISALRFIEDGGEEDRAFRAIFRAEDGIRFHEPYGDLPADEVPLAFEKLKTRLQSKLIEAAKAPERQEASPLYEGPMMDWQASLPDSLAELEEHLRRPYRVKLERSAYQFYVDIAPAHTEPDELSGKHQMSLFIEVNDGLPCVHISNDIYGDQVLTVFATADGLYLRPDTFDTYIRTGAPGDDAPELQAQMEREKGPFESAKHHVGVRNHAFILAPNH